jgi:hypothetical protein
MSEIIAALILACSNLTHGDSGTDARIKGECILRVSRCSITASQTFGGDLDRTRQVLQCAKEVHL